MTAPAEVAAVIERHVTWPDPEPLLDDAAALHDFDAYTAAEPQQSCVTCGTPGAPECARCYAAHDHTIARLTDI